MDKNREARRNARRAAVAKVDGPTKEAQQTLAREIMDTVFDLARSAVRARARLRNEGYVVEDLPHEPAVYALLGLEPEAPKSPIVTPEKKGIVTVLGDRARRLLS